VPAGLPALSIPLPALRLPGGRELRLGDSLEKVVSLLGREAETGVEVVEQGRTGTRLTRGYEYAHMRFTIVFEPFERNGEFRIAGIYLQ
jgi:formylmethanofuran dehydrogenase subunit A